MVWCAMESADYKPSETDAIQLFQPYGWIHWGGETWHTVTGYELGKPGEEAHGIQVPQIAAFVGAYGSRQPYVGDELFDGAHGDELNVHFAANAADQSAQPSAEPEPPGEQHLPAAPDPSAEPRPSADMAAAPPPPPPQPPSSGDATAWDADHKRDEDRADTQHTLDNTRWDAQHTLDNARWDTRHTLENARWDAQHTLDNARWDSWHAVENARWDASLALKHAREDAALANDMAMLQAVHGGYLAVAQASLDRAVQRATYVATAAGAVGTLYTGILAARYTTNHQAPARSILPALFIGAAVAFSTWYMAFLRGHTRNQQLLVSGSGGSIAETRLLDFLEWTFNGVLARAWSLRVSVISLALGLALLPLGLVQVSSGTSDLIGFAALGVLLLWLFVEFIVALWPRELKQARQSGKPRLAPGSPKLPAKPRGGSRPTGPRSYGMDYRPPAAPWGADGVNPPPPPDVADGPPPTAPKGAASADPPTPPAPAGTPEPPGPLPGPLAPGQRPSSGAPGPEEMKVDLRFRVDRPGKH